MKQPTPAKEIFQLMKNEKCRQITFHYDPKTDMKLVWVVDSIPEKRNKKNKLKGDVSVSGGTRFAHKDEDVAMQDAIKLARAMTRKAKVLNINEGGSKAVVLADKKKTIPFLKSIGDFIQIHKGLFKTAIDLGFNMNDAKTIASRADHIDSLSHLEKGLGSTGENTAEGVINGLRIASKEYLHKPLSNCSIAIQGLGAVGFPLARKLIVEGCSVMGSDLDKQICRRAKRMGVKIISPSNILFQNIDILSPCALGGVINQKNIGKLKCKMIAGGANNQLDNEFKTEKALLKNKIVYVPDFVLNSGGFLQALVERNGGTAKEAKIKTKIIAKQLRRVINLSRKNNITLLEAATKLFQTK